MALKRDFPLGMRVLAVNDDPASLKSLENLLTRCQYNVEVTTRPTIAMRILRRNRDRQFDMIITDVHTEDMDGFEFIKLVDNEFHIPVIIVSEDGRQETIAKAVAHGGCDFLLKPVRVQELRNIWTHVLRRKLASSTSSKGRPVVDDLYILQDQEVRDQDGGRRRLNVDRQHEHQQKHKFRLIPAGGERGGRGKEGKRRRLRWTEELHHKFLAAAHTLGLDKAVPKKILDLMDVDDLTLDHVSSHLQKYKLYVKKLSEVTGRHALVAAHSYQQQQQQQQTQPEPIDNANGNNFPLQPNWIQGFSAPSDHPNDDNSLSDPTELFYDLVDFNSLDQLLQHDQTWQHGVATSEPTGTVLGDLPSVLMTPLFGDPINSDSNFYRILQPIVPDDDGSSPIPRGNFSNHLVNQASSEILESGQVTHSGRGGLVK